MAKNQILPTVSDFRTVFPQFSYTTRYPDAQIQFRLNLADVLLSEKITGKNLLPYFVELFVAHYMVLWGADSRAIATGGSGGVSGGIQL